MLCHQLAASPDGPAQQNRYAADRAERGSHVGCIAGALSITEYRDGLARAGFADISITATHEVVDGMHSAIIRAIKTTAPHHRVDATS